METGKAVEFPKDPKSELFSDAESDELNEELDALITDKQYHDFVYDVAHNKDVVDDEHDKDYEPSEDGAKVAVKENVDEGIAEENEASVEVTDGIDSSSISSSEDEEGVNDAADEDHHTELKIPMEMLKETEKRFPPFWRTKQALKNFEGSSYKSEDDIDYVPEEDEDASQEDRGEPLQEAPQEIYNQVEERNEAEEYRGEEADEDADSLDLEEVESEMEMKQEAEELVNDQQKPIQQDVDNLVSMVEMLTLPPENSTAEEVSDSDSDAMEEDVPGEEKPENILNFDADGYNSAEDPDFVPNEKEAEDVDSAATSSDEESSDEVERME